MEETKKLFCELMPRVLNEDILSFLCIKHKNEIAIGSNFDKRSPRIRYVIDKNRFGYATLVTSSFGKMAVCMFGNRVKNLKKTIILTL